MLLRKVKGKNEIRVLDFCRENLRNALLSVYGNKEYVDDDLVEVPNSFHLCVLSRVL